MRHKVILVWQHEGLWPYWACTGAAVAAVGAVIAAAPVEPTAAAAATAASQLPWDTTCLLLLLSGVLVPLRAESVLQRLLRPFPVPSALRFVPWDMTTTLLVLLHVWLWRLLMGRPPLLLLLLLNRDACNAIRIGREGRRHAASPPCLLRVHHRLVRLWLLLPLRMLQKRRGDT